MIEIQIGTTEEHILRYLQHHYPVTFIELAKTLHISQATLKRTLLRLQHQGIVRIDPLPGNTYVRLLRTDFYYIGNAKPHKTAPRRPKTPHDTTPDYDGMMYS
jgi:DNA-binding IclR family transcriptional regulator